MRPDAVKKWPVVDDDGTLTDVFMGNTQPEHIDAMAYRGADNNTNHNNNGNGEDGAPSPDLAAYAPLTSSDRGTGGHHC